MWAIRRTGDFVAPDDGEVHLWWWRLDGCPMDAPPALDRVGRDQTPAGAAPVMGRPTTHLLSPDEQVRAARYRFDLPRRRFVAARVGLRRLLSRYLSLEDPRALVFHSGPQGKPFLDTPAHRWLRFNLTHTGDLALCAVACERDVGVDVEQLDGGYLTSGFMQAAARRFFSSPERALLDRQSPLPECQKRTFLALWTCKEAVGKARGTGLVPPVPFFDRAITSAPANDLSPWWWQQDHPDTGGRARGRTWFVTWTEMLPGAVAAVAVETTASTVRDPQHMTWFELA